MRTLAIAVSTLILAACGATVVTPPPSETGCSTANCSAPRECLADGSCGFDPARRWYVQPESSEIASTNNGVDWDGDASPPDAFVAVWCPDGSTVESDTEEVESFTPAWTTGGCELTEEELVTDGFDFQVVDSDVSANDPITATYKAKATEDDLVSGGLNFTNLDGTTSLSFTLSRE